MPALVLAAVVTLAASSAATVPAAPAALPPPSTSQAMTLKLDRDEGADHMCPTNGQLASFQANAGVDNAPVMVELLGLDHKPLADKTWSAVAGLRVLPLIQGPLRITMICSVGKSPD